MNIIDLRPWPQRLWERRAAAGDAPGLPARLAAAAADALIRARVARRRPPPQSLAVVSVGNLAVGGTGKTPVVAALATALGRAGRPGAVLTRGYGSRHAGVLAVSPDDPRAGDEARLLAALVGPGWLVLQARNRRRGLARLADVLPEGAVVILDDGHQTAGIGRHLDVLILDRWTTAAGPGGAVLQPRTGPVVPLGPWRESAQGAARAAVWLVEAADPPRAGAGDRAVAGFVREVEVRAAAVDAPAIVPSAGWAALSGIARPGRFETGVAAVLGSPPVLALRCADHAPYGARLRARVVAALRAAGGPLTVTTRKDWVKLEAGWPADLPVAVAELTVRWTGERALPDLVGERLDALTGSGGYSRQSE